MKIVAIYNFKGGPGKTTLTHHLATGLAILGKRVLVLDTDPQGHASLLLGVIPSGKLYDYLARGASFREVAQLIARSQYVPEGENITGNIALIAGNDETSFIPMKVRDPRVMRLNLQKVAHEFDICLIDTPPTPSLMSAITYAACDAVLYPTMCEMLHIDGLKRAIAARAEADTIRMSLNLGEIKVLGIQPTIYRKNVSEHKEYYAWLQHNFDNVWTPLSQSAIWSEATRTYKPVFSYAPKTQAAQEAWAFVNRFEQELWA